LSARGRFITVEGQDGAGKTTNLAFVRRRLEQARIAVLETREPGGTALGEMLREIVLHRRGLGVAPLAELLLIFAARAQHLQEKIEPALAGGTWVLCDRFTDATYAYQGGGCGLPEHSIGELERLVQGGLRPDLTLLLDVDTGTGMRRRPQPGGPVRVGGPAFQGGGACELPRAGARGTRPDQGH
jgi:dTMP kinase